MSENVVFSTDGRRRLRVLQRSDGYFSILEETIHHDAEEGVTYWTKQMTAFPGIYLSAETAVREIRTWPEFRSEDRVRHSPEPDICELD
jgi:hypothetical protein